MNKHSFFRYVKFQNFVKPDFRRIKEVLQYNEDVIKFINSGVRIFSRTEAKCHDAAYRVTQDGINTMRSVCTKQNVSTHSLDDIKILLEEELPNIEKFRYEKLTTVIPCSKKF